MLRVTSLFILLLAFFITSCEDVGVRSRYIANDSNIDGGTTAGSGNGNSSNPTDGGVTTEPEEVDPQVEIRHLIEPKVDSNSETGAYVRKLTLPKNYNGFLYVAGLNVSSLSDRVTHVRFNFGVNKSPITIPATISTAAGLTPQTNTEVLVLDMRDEPFRNVRLLYDLFDYNSYDFTGADENKLDTPVQNNRDKNLFCRGVLLEDDPTFTGNIANGCSGSSDVCKYAYAKVLDKGLVRNDSGLALYPKGVQAESNGSGYYQDANSTILNRCLPDRSSNYKFNDSINFGAYLSSASIDSVSYSYVGPYQATGLGNWQISGSALTNAYGIFESYLDPANPNTTAKLNSGVGSKLFPLYTQIQLGVGVEHFGSDTPDGVKSAGNELNVSGPSYWMDGCNARASTRAEITNESIGSCNVTASIEIIALGDDGETEVVVDKTTEVKLQLVKEATLNTDGENILSSSFQSCTTSSQCGSGSCCFNNRCWSKSIVSQCIDESQNVGNLVPGEACNSDLQCASLCCNPSTGRCGVHDTYANPPVLCSKPFGQACIAKEWCAKETKTQCFIVKTGFDSQNQVTCALRCYTTQEFGDCQNGRCVAGPTPEVPVFNPNDPNRCDEAYDPSELPINIQSN